MPDTTADRLTAVLRRLPEPAAPATLEATVMARIARLPPPAPDVARERARRRRERAARVWAIAGLLLLLGFDVYDRAASALPGAFGLTPAMTTGLGAMPSGVMPAALLVLGLALYAAGLFAQTGGGGGRIRER